ncbi:MAG: spondin domain-containing protein [Salinibacter sp.]|uniref:spondin domain-containing protein n=1 Tax=Salinibacter sp. TaxID=2065818 RepID=UPI0035D4F83B
MTSRPILSHVPFAFLWIGCFALVLAGCDSNEGDPPSPNTFEVTVENVQNGGSATPILKSGEFVSPEGQDGPGPIMNGDSYEFFFTAGPRELPKTGMRLSFATMFIQSNDLYYAFEPGGLSLFENGTPIGQNSPRDVTSEVNLYDAGTEGDQEPGSGSDQAPRQSALDTGPDGEGSVVEVTDQDGDGRLENDGFSYPATDDVVKVTVESESHEDGGVAFTVTIRNRGASVNGAPIPLSPGSYAVHWDQMPGSDGGDVTFPGHNPGGSAGDGIESIAEDGRPGGALPPDDSSPAGNHLQTLRGRTGITVPLSPGAFAIHSDDVSLFETGAEASGGIEAIAEDGRPNGALDGDAGSPAGNLVADLTGTNGIKSVDPFGGGPILPGNEVSFNVNATPGDRLSLATMYIQSNDLFYATPQEGIALFDENDQPINREIDILLYDAGTEGDQEPGVGLDQAPRQSALNTGPNGEGSVTQVNGSDDGFSYPSSSDVIRVSVRPASSQ